MKMLVLLSVLAVAQYSVGQNFINVDTSSQVDQTLVAGSSGKPVVTAATQKLEAVPGFLNDFSLMARIALVESNYGENNKGSLGGIWEITTTIQVTLRGSLSSSVQTIVNEAGCILGQENTNLTNTDFSTPIRSAFAARIFIQQRVGSSGVPITLTQQATWWSTVYRPGANATKFIELVSQMENVTVGCASHKLDLWFVIDGSGSVGLSNFQDSLRFLANLTKRFTIGPDDVRVGFSVYSSASTIHSHFNQHMNNSALEAEILGTSYPSGGTSTGRAINDVLNNGFVERNGARPASEGVPRILVVLTDGRSGDSVKTPSDNIKAAGITVFGVGIGSGIDIAEVNEIASNPDSRYAFELTGFNLLNVLSQRLTDESCLATASVPDSTSISVSIQSGEPHFSKYSFPSNGSIELVFQTPPGGAGIVYISGNVANPSAALNTISFRITVGKITIFLNAEALRGGVKLGSGCTTVTQKDILDVFTTVQSTGNTSLNLNVTSTSKNESVLPVLGQECTYGVASAQDTSALQTVQCGPNQICATYYGSASLDGAAAEDGSISACVDADQCGANHCLQVGSSFNGYTVVTCERSTCCNSSACNQPVFPASNVTVTCPAVPANAPLAMLKSDFICQFMKWTFEIQNVWHPVFDNWRQNVAGVNMPLPNVQCMQLAVTCRNPGQFRHFNLMMGTCRLPYCVDGHYLTGPGIKEWKVAHKYWQNLYTIWQNTNVVV
ncbi:uncharacterized protein LOC100186070 [Ciona intestinalis]